MNYFVGSLYGNLNAYTALKEKLKLKNTDMLWILGDIMDGISCNPQDCIDMIEDIARQPNMNLLIGDHEFAHIMRYISKENNESYQSWRDYSLSLSQPAEDMIDFFENEMDEEDQSDLFAFLIHKCEISYLIKIGDNFFYLTHGFPVKYDGNMTSWQFQSVCSPAGESDFLANIKTDPAIREMVPLLTKDNTFVICSHEPPSSMPPESGGIYHNNGIFFLNTDLHENQIPVLGIDAAGYFFRNIPY